MRLSLLSDVLFPVEEHPVFVVLRDESRRSPASTHRNKKAIVNTANHRVLGIVSRDYQLVTNHEALEWAYECCQNVFPNTNPAEWDVSATDGPQLVAIAGSIRCTERQRWTLATCDRDNDPKHSDRSFASRTATTGCGRSRSISASIARFARMV